MTARQEPDPRAGERELLLGWLAFHRETLARKCAGLAPEQLARMSVPPSNLSLLGLVRHMTEMERVYLVHGIGGGRLELVYCSEEDPEADFEGVADADPGAAFEAWRAERARADELIAGAERLDARGGNGWPLRSNVLKVVGEYARHNGHADLLRECIDGAVGE